MSWSGNDAEPVTVTLGCRCGHERAAVTAAELAADHAGYLRQHRLHVADALLAMEGVWP